MLDKTNRSILPKKNTPEREMVSKNTGNLMIKQKETDIKFGNHRNNHNYLPWQQAAITVDESTVNDKTNYLQQNCVEAEESPTQNQSSKAFPTLRDITGKSTTSSATNVSRRIRKTF